MRLLFVTGRPYLPERTGGAELSVHGLLRGLRARGFSVEAVAALGASWRRPAYRALRLLSRRLVLGLPDTTNGYPTRRAWEDLLPALVDERLQRARPDLVLAQLEGCAGFARRAIERGVPAVIRLPDPTLRWLDGPLPGGPLIATIANSQHSAGRIAEKLGARPQVIYPIVERAPVRAQEARGEFVTFINPVPDKGLDLALAIAHALPRQRFLFVEAWPLGARALASLRAELSRLPNVTLRRWSLDMRAVYQRTAVLLVPSRWEESFPRVIVEAHVNAIPVVASADGGIPEALGEGGVLLPASAGAGEWSAAIARLIADPAEWRAASRRAAANVLRPELDPDVQIDRFVAIARGLVEAAQAGAGSGAR